MREIEALAAAAGIPVDTLMASHAANFTPDAGADSFIQKQFAKAGMAAARGNSSGIYSSADRLSNAADRGYYLGPQGRVSLDQAQRTSLIDHAEYLRTSGPPQARMMHEVKRAGALRSRFGVLSSTADFARNNGGNVPVGPLLDASARIGGTVAEFGGQYGSEYPDLTTDLSEMQSQLQSRAEEVRDQHAYDSNTLSTSAKGRRVMERRDKELYDRSNRAGAENYRDLQRGVKAEEKDFYRQAKLADQARAIEERSEVKERREQEAFGEAYSRDYEKLSQNQYRNRVRIGMGQAKDAEKANDERYEVINGARDKFDNAQGFLGAAKDPAFSAIADSLKRMGTNKMESLLQELVRLQADSKRLRESNDPLDHAAANEADTLAAQIGKGIGQSGKGRFGGGIGGFFQGAAKSFANGNFNLGEIATAGLTGAGVPGVGLGIAGVAAIMGANALTYNLGQKARGEESQYFGLGNQLNVRGRILENLYPSRGKLDSRLMAAGYGDTEQVGDFLGTLGAVGVQNQANLAVTGGNLARMRGLDLGQVAGIGSTARIAGGNMDAAGITQFYGQLSQVLSDGVERGVNASKLLDATNSLVEASASSAGGVLGGGALGDLMARLDNMQNSNNAALRGASGAAIAGAISESRSNAPIEGLGLVNANIQNQMRATGKSFGRLAVGGATDARSLAEMQLLNEQYASNPAAAIQMGMDFKAPGLAAMYDQSAQQLGGGNSGRERLALKGLYPNMALSQIDQVMLGMKMDGKSFSQEIGPGGRFEGLRPDAQGGANNITTNTLGQGAIDQFARTAQIQLQQSRLFLEGFKGFNDVFQQGALGIYQASLNFLDTTNILAGNAPNKGRGLTPGSPAEIALRGSSSSVSGSGGILGQIFNAPGAAVATALDWGGGGSVKGLSPKSALNEAGFIEGVNAMAARLGVGSADLLRVMNAESKIDPHARNYDKKDGRTIAGGLIQFTRLAGYDPEAMASMTGVQQLASVEAYYKKQGVRPGMNFGDLYMATHYPIAMGMADSTVLYGEGGEGIGMNASRRATAYRQNTGGNRNGVDLNHDGQVTKGELIAWAIKASGMTGGANTSHSSSVNVSGTITVNGTAVSSATGAKIGAKITSKVVPAVKAGMRPANTGRSSRP